MGWFDRLLGRETLAPPAAVKARATDGWKSSEEEVRAQTTKAFLEQVASLAGVADAVIDPRPQDHDTDLRGTLHGYPLRVRVTDAGDLRSVTLRYTSKLTFIDLEHDRDLRVTPTAQAVAPWDASEQQILLAPQIFVEGSGAEAAAAAFRTLPAELQSRVLGGMRTLRIRYFRSRPEEHDVTMHDDPHEVDDPARWLADVLLLSADVAKARGVRPPGKGSNQSPAELAALLAAAIAAQVAGAKIVARDADEAIDVRWLEEGVPVRIVLDLTFKDLDVEVQAAGVTGTFGLTRDPDVTVEKHPESGDAWDAADRHIFFARSVFVNGPEAAARREAAILRSVGAPLLDALVGEMETLDVAWLELEDGMLTTTLCDLDEVADDGAGAIRFARLLARVTAALPRGGGGSLDQAIRCAYCHGLWFPSSSHPTCTHCGARP